MKGDKRTEIDDYSFKHFQVRALERYEKDLNERDYKKMNEIIKELINVGIAPLAVEKDTDTYHVDYNDVRYVCVWNRENNEIATLLPKGTVVSKYKKKNKK